MASVNRVIILGNLGNDPEQRTTATGDMVVSMSVATSRKTKQGNETEWHNVTCFRRTAEIAAQYLKKGSSVYIEGSIHTNKYTDKNGIDRYQTVIYADNLTMMGDRKDSNQSNNNYQKVATAPVVADVPDDDIPF